MTEPAHSPSLLFTPTPLTRRKELHQSAARVFLFVMALAMIVPLFLIIGYLVWKAAPSLHWSFLFDVPRDGMREGGIWPAFVGTLYLVIISLAIAAPIGILAAVYLT